MVMAMAIEREDVRPNSLSDRAAHLRDLALAFANDPDPTERGWAVMRSYDQNRAQPVSIKRARAVADIIAAQSLCLDDGDLLAGRLRRGIPGHPGIYEEFSWVRAAMYPELFPNVSSLRDAPVDDAYRRFMAGWVERHVSAGQKVAAMRPADAAQALRLQVFGSYGVDMVHRLPRMELLLHKGISGLRQEIGDQLAVDDGLSIDSVRRRCFYQGQLVICQAFETLAMRWAHYLYQLADSEESADRAGELSQMAANCVHVATEPAQTLWQALQMCWFVICLCGAETCGSAHCFGRLDQYMLPYYDQDIASGALTAHLARELISCLFLKCYRTFDFHHTTLGGLTSDGHDATNELSYLCLDVVRQLRTPRDVAVRIHRDTPSDFFDLAVEVACLGLGRPDFWNDEVTIDALSGAGFALEDARDYAPIGCVELTIPGKCNPRTMGHSLNLTKILELTLHGGQCLVTGEQVSADVPETFESYGALRGVFRQEMARFVRMALQDNVRGHQVQAQELPFPVLSLLTVGCMESGRDVMDGGAIYNPAGVNLQGVANTADALEAIRQMVYDKGQLCLDDLRAAVRDDYQGQESLRQGLIHRVPKFGNDQGSVDQIAAELVRDYAQALAQYRTSEGGPYLPLLFGCTPAAVHNVGPKTAASPDGRRCGAPLATSVNPTHGRNRTGVTAELASVSRIDYRQASGGISFIVDLHPTVVAGDEGVGKLVDLLRTFFDLGGMEIGLNVVQEEDLRAAQEEPERYAHLMVRVFGFSAPFVSLDREIQEEVIAKTKHMN